MFKFDLMRKLFAILFLSVYVFSTTELIQLLKLPLLIEHYLEHKTRNATLSLSSFMAIHYADDHLENHPQDEDYDQDKRLPFMVHSTTLNFIFLSPTVCKLEVIKMDQDVPETKIPFADDRLIVSSYLSNIWQPPRIV